MAIVQISKIQHRRGLSENLPQLASAEFGWVVDQRKLYIGNGSLTEGAPEIGNTEILTQYSDILGLISSYVYKGEHAGYTVQNAVARSLQRKLDERVSVLDFGATGDGSTDDTAAIQQAIQQVFIRELNPETRRALYFPAGKYIISDVITLPPYAIFYGDGPDSTEIVQTGSVACVARTADSLNQIYPAIGANSADSPNHIIIKDMNFTQTTDNTVVQIDSAYDCRFSNVKFIGPTEPAPTTEGNENSCVFITSTPAEDTHTIVFHQCEFEAHNYGIKIDDDVNHVIIDSCTFDNLFKGVVLGKDTTGSGNSIVGPRAIKIKNSYFDNIYSTAVHGYAVSQNMSSFNTYRDCANGLAGQSNPIASVIDFGADDNYSVADNFDRPDDDDSLFSRVEFNGFLCYSLESDNWSKHGRLKTFPGKQTTLQNNTTNSTVSGLEFDLLDQEQPIIEYTIKRGPFVSRRGTLYISFDDGNADISDDYVESNTNSGVTFGVFIDVDDKVKITYTTNDLSVDATMRYNTRTLTP